MLHTIVSILKCCPKMAAKVCERQFWILPGLFMKKRNIFSSELKESVVRAFDLPPDLAYGSVLVSVTGQSELLIENYRGILEYKDEHIRIQAKDCRILIVGKRLGIEYYTNEEMKIKGLIEQIIYEN